MRIILIGLICLAVFPFRAQGEDVSIEDLLNDPELYNGKAVYIEAEALDVLRQAQGAWINVSDETESIGVWVKKGIPLPEIKHFTSYKQQGDLIAVRGTFQASCKEHFGQHDIHAQEVVIVQEGSLIEEVISLRQKQLMRFSFYLFVLVVCVYVLKRVIHAGRTEKN